LSRVCEEPTWSRGVAEKPTTLLLLLVILAHAKHPAYLLLRLILLRTLAKA
jgi:hypothetical protein